MAETKIELIKYEWNLVTGCEGITPGCDNCYVNPYITTCGEDISADRYEDVEIHAEKLEEPNKLNQPHEIFLCPMSDLFHWKVPNWFILEVLDVIRNNPRHNFKLLTKRSRRMANALTRFRVYKGKSTLSKIVSNVPLPENLWLGVSCETQQTYDKRIDELCRVKSKIRFLFLEPLLGPITLKLRKIDWVVVGGEFGPNHRPMNPDWVRSIRDQCVKANVPFFFKQWGGNTPKANGRLLDGREWNQKPPINTEPVQLEFDI